MTKILRIILALVAVSQAQTSLTVNASSVLADVSRRPLGINVNYLMDDDTYLNPARSTKEALKEMGVKYLRYPGGEKSDNYLWSVSPWNRSDPHFARTGSEDWPSNDGRFTQSGRYACKPTVLDFDEFMTICQYVGAKPVIVVCFDAMYKAASSGGIAPTKQQLKETAVEWVRYANITKRYGVMYWEIGNESYLTSSYNGMAPSATVYAQDLMEFARAMKAVDPTIKIAANGNGGWWQALLQTASNDIDWLSAHTYPTSGYTGYNQYMNSPSVFTGEIGAALNAITSYAPGLGKFVSITEYNTINWGAGWANKNDLGHALAAFDMAGQHLFSTQTQFVLFWNTRWVENTTKPYDVNDAIDRNGNLNPNGRALAIWNSFLLSKMVSVSGISSTVRAWASASTARDSLSIYVLNKSTTVQNVAVSVSNYMGKPRGARWEFSGGTPEDTLPKWGFKDSASIGSLVLSMPATSVTVLSFRGSENPAIKRPASGTKTKSGRSGSPTVYDVRGRTIPASPADSKGLDGKSSLGIILESAEKTKRKCRIP